MARDELFCYILLTGSDRPVSHRSANNDPTRPRRSEHVTPLLRDLHWLKVPERVQFRLCVMAYRCLHGTAPPYLAETLHLTSSVESPRRLRSSSTSALCTTRAGNSANDDWRSGVSFGCCTRLECSPGLCQDVVIVHGAQTTAENATVQGIVL